MLLEDHSDWEILYYIYDMVDELLKVISPIATQKLLVNQNNRGGRPPQLDLASVISLGIFKFALGVEDTKHYHRILLWHYNDQLGKIPTYANFNRLLNQSLPWIIMILQLLMHRNKSSSEALYFIDSTSLKACENKRIFHHKVLDGIAGRGKTSMGWFYGLKLHMVCNANGDLVSMLFTPGNVDDRRPVKKLLKKLKGLVVADAGYVSATLMKELSLQGITFITDVRKSMKRLMTPTQHALLKLRQRAEIVFSNIKYRLSAVQTKARSPVGYLRRCIFACLTYLFQRSLLTESKQLTT